MQSQEKKTSLYESHKLMGAKMAPFGGWLMPISYSSVLAEHEAVRNKCGVFDVSHMGEVRVSGPDALKYLTSITSNDPSRLAIGCGQYSAILTETGGFVDDLIVYRVGESEYFICINAGNIEKDVDWFKKHVMDFNVSVEDESQKWAQLAVQGPDSRRILSELVDPSVKETFLKLPYTNIGTFKILGVDCLIARTGYTGELGYEVYMAPEMVANIWNSLVSGANPKATPIGLGARDTLRLEACYLLYGNDMDEATTPLEAGIAWAVKLEGRDFVGSKALRNHKTNGVLRTMIAFKLTESGVPRHGMDLYYRNLKIGVVTSGGVLPTVGGSGGMAIVKNNMLKLGDVIEVDVRGKRKLAHVMKRPLYSAKVKE